MQEKDGKVILVSISDDEFLAFNVSGDLRQLTFIRRCLAVL